jgi:hypothetical protein
MGERIPILNVEGRDEGRERRKIRWRKFWRSGKIVKM